MTGDSERPLFVCFFGVTRALSHTIDSIRENVIAPAAALGPVRIYAHIYDLTGAEAVTTEARHFVEEAHLLGADPLMRERPQDCLDTELLERLKPYGDRWRNGFVSLKKLLLQQHSLRRVGEAALADGAEIVAFCRPDMRYHDSLGPVYARARANREPTVHVPDWASWGGHNDRFAVASGRAAVHAYATRLDRALEFCEATGEPLQSERLVAHALSRGGIRVEKMKVRATRYRAGGKPAREFFESWDNGVPWRIVLASRMRDIPQLPVFAPARRLRKAVLARLRPSR